MDIWSWLKGMVSVELVSASSEDVLRIANTCNICVYSIQKIDEMTLRFAVRPQDFQKLRNMLEPRGSNLQILRHIGPFWRMKKLFHRPVLLTGILMFFLLTLLLPKRILFLQVQGNEQLPERLVLSTAEKCGIRFFTSRRQVRSEAVKNAMLLELPQLQWVGVNTRGCTAVISVREKNKVGPTRQFPAIGHLTAIRDGLVESVTVSRGELLCSPGQAVKAGQILISGYTDCGLCIRATVAEGEIYALTNRQIRVIIPESFLVSRNDHASKQKFSILLGKKRINLWKDSGIWDTTCGRMYKEYYITLPGGFSLPLGIAVDTYVSRSLSNSDLPQQELEKILSAFGRNCVHSDMIAGEILQPVESFDRNDGVVSLCGEYLCREMIGRIQWEQIGE